MKRQIKLETAKAGYRVAFEFSSATRSWVSISMAEVQQLLETAPETVWLRSC